MNWIGVSTKTVWDVFQVQNVGIEGLQQTNFPKKEEDSFILHARPMDVSKIVLQTMGFAKGTQGPMSGNIQGFESQRVKLF